MDNEITFIKLEGKKLTVKLKYGWTISDFAQKYNCTEETFLRFLERNFSSKAYKNILNCLEKNKKKIRQPFKTKKTIDLNRREINVLEKLNSA